MRVGYLRMHVHTCVMTFFGSSSVIKSSRLRLMRVLPTNLERKLAPEYLRTQVPPTPLPIAYPSA